MKINQTIFFIGFCLLLISCKETEEHLQIILPVAGGDWVIYQLAKIHALDIPVGDQSFSGTIGGVTVSLGRIPVDTLIFIIPDVGIGPTQLKVTMGRQIRTWDLQLSKWPDFQDKEIFLEAFLKSTRTLQNEIQVTDELKELASPFGTWINFFTQKQQQLSDLEKENNLFFRNAYDRQLQCPIGLELMKLCLLKDME